MDSMDVIPLGSASYSGISYEGIANQEGQASNGQFQPQFQSPSFTDAFDVFGNFNLLAPTQTNGLSLSTTGNAGNSVYFEVNQFSEQTVEHEILEKPIKHETRKRRVAEKKRDAAREYRKRKKEYISELETQVAQLNTKLQQAQCLFKNLTGMGAPTGSSTTVGLTSMPVPTPSNATQITTPTLPNNANSSNGASTIRPSNPNPSPNTVPSSDSSSSTSTTVTKSSTFPPTLPRAQRNEMILKLQRECQEVVEELEEVVKKNQPVDNVVMTLHAKSKTLYNLWKQHYMEQLDFTVFANFAFFGYNFYHLRGYGEVPDNAKDLEENELENVNRYSELGLWQDMARGLFISNETIAQIVSHMRRLRTEIIHLKKEHQQLNEILVKQLQTPVESGSFWATVAEKQPFLATLPRDNNNPTDKDFFGVSQLVQLTATLGKIRDNYLNHWAAWERATEAVSNVLTPHQRAMLLLRKKAYMERMTILNSLWSTLNGLVPPAPTYSFIPLPVHHTWPFL